jgi:hypothetical protein
VVRAHERAVVVSHGRRTDRLFSHSFRSRNDYYTNTAIRKSFRRHRSA